MDETFTMVARKFVAEIWREPRAKPLHAPISNLDDEIISPGRYQKKHSSATTELSTNNQLSFSFYQSSFAVSVLLEQLRLRTDTAHGAAICNLIFEIPSHSNCQSLPCRIFPISSSI
jgi:hypothetical protein